MDAPALRMTRDEVLLAERVGKFLLPVIRAALDQRLGKTSDAAAFAREFRQMQRARDAMPATASPTARAEIEADMLELAQRFAATHHKE
jgi:hypothetical protein